MNTAINLICTVYSCKILKAISYIGTKISDFISKPTTAKFVRYG